MKLASSLAACVTLAVLVTVMAQERPQPVLLGSFETAEESKPFAAVGGCKAERVQEHAAQGQWALKVLFPGSPKDTWPGLAYKPVGDLSKYELLAFDVFNPSDEKVSLSIRIDPAEGEAVFSGYSLKPKGMTTCDIYLKGYADGTGAVRLKQILPYRRMPREDATLYFDNFRLGFAMDKFKETVYADDSPMPDLTAADRERGFVLFARPYLDAVFPNTIPKPEELNPKLDLFAARGEREPVTFSVRALRDLKGLTATVSPLDDGAGHGIPASLVEVRLVRNLRKRFHYAALEYILMPTYLELAKPLDLPANTAQRFWLTVHVPEDAAPAIYHGRVTVRAEGAEATIPLRLRVLPFKLDDPPGIAYGPYYRPHQLAKQGDLAAQRDFIRRDLQDMRDHGMTSLGLCVGLDSAKVKMDGDKVDLGLDGASPFEMALDAYRDLRFPEPVCLLTDGAQSFAGKHKLETDEFASAYKAVTMALNAEAKRRGWPEIILQPVDEPAWQDKAACDRNV
ncbi:MAG: hypothetical protein FJ272_09375, partial [Planctomycetes bacterium]|nr:hypothetical protein [Planctomycetota bacterium]